MITIGYGVFNGTTGGGGGFSNPYLPSSYSGSGWSSPENAYDGSGVTTGTQSTIDMSSCVAGQFLYDNSSVEETYSYASETGFSQIVIAGDYTYDLTSDAVQWTSGSDEIYTTGNVTGTAQYSILVSVDGGSNWSTILLINCNTTGGGMNPSGQNLTGSGQFGASIYSGSGFSLPANLNLLKIKLKSYVTAAARRALDVNDSPNTLYSASGIAIGTAANMTVTLS
jgi:hypothetical protein